jgi:hypothetical protein
LVRASAFALGVLLPAIVGAQIKPRILIIFDTSGSMMWNTLDQQQPGDGSPLCATQDPTGLGKSSRVYQLKQALFDVLQGVGAQEVDWALSTFPMFVDPQRTPVCPWDPQCWSQPPLSCAGHYYVTNTQDSEVPGWEKHNACKVSSHFPDTQQTATCGTSACPWYPAYKQEVLKVPFAGSTPEKVMIYFDQQEDPGPVTTLINPEVRAGAAWWTPLGKSLFYSYGYFHNEVLLPPTDPQKPCEKNVVIMFTDGVESCNTDTQGPAFRPTLWASKLHNELGATVHVVAIDLDPEFVAGLQDIATFGGGSAYFVQGTTSSLKTAIQDIIAKSLPPRESCNGKDDDCDGQIDEDFPLKGQPCNNGRLGVCYRTGTYVCAPDGSGVTCTAPLVFGSPEVCNGKDDDCNGQIDEIPGCIPCAPQPEVCNGKDDNCNGQIDEGLISVSCGKGVGECTLGMTQCIAGQVVCTGGLGPQSEVCNGKDDDCDGVRDGMAEPCYSFPVGCALATGVCAGPCRLGIRTCLAVQTGGAWVGQWGACVGDKGPDKEICDGQDNDCDGTADEDAECPAGMSCVNGECVSPCSGVEFSCPKDSFCQNGWCVPEPCTKMTCPPGQICQAGNCIDPCHDKTCASWETCVEGACQDLTCYGSRNPCPPGEKCINSACQADPCAGVTCGADKYCVGGTCVPLCDTVPCPAGTKCIQGGCYADPCADQICGKGEMCSSASGTPTCITDPCETAAPCAPGKVCVADGAETTKCVVDPCETVTCPETYACRLGDCVTTALHTTRVLATGSGGCSCEHARGAEEPWPLWVLLPLLGWMVTRRRPATPARRAQRS